MNSPSFWQLPLGYHDPVEIYQDAKTIVLRAIHTLNGISQPVVIKLLASARPTYQELLQFRHQYNITRNLQLSGIVQTYRLEEYGQSYALVMENFEGISLAQYQRVQNLSLSDILDIAIQIAAILHDLGQERIIHNNIQPANLLINPVTKQVKLIDFGMASSLPRTSAPLVSPYLLPGTLAYLSPEQTGRMNRGVDYRSDFYACGITLYELLTGKLPFVADTPLELIHCHLAQNAQSVHLVNPSIPIAMSELVAKLMTKNAENRYQSARGLKHDLEYCQRQWVATETIAEFALGQRDVGNRFIIPEKLYGREIAVQTLLAAFDRIVASQKQAALAGQPELSPELLLVAGCSGLGKTAVINEIHQPITRYRGYFIKGKFDQFQRNIPLSAFVQAFQDLIGQLLSESDAQIAQWKTEIAAAVGENGQVLTAVIPHLEKIIGSQPPVPALSGLAAQSRFHRVSQKFMAVFTTAARPLTIFLDDLQWADLASLQLIEILMAGAGSLLLLGAYRDNEVAATDPLLLTVARLQQAQKNIQTITIAPLSSIETNCLVADTLHCSVDRALPLTEFIHLQTQGNPFFTTQYLKALHEDGEIIFNPAGYWECDIARVQALSLTADILELTEQRLQKLPIATQQVLKLAACLDNQFKLETIATIAQQSATKTLEIMWPALQAGLILPVSQIHQFLPTDLDLQSVPAEVPVIYRFLHDRVQQATYNSMPVKDRALTHQKIGQLLLAQIPKAEIDEHIFVVVNQLNHGIGQLTHQDASDWLAVLNLRAGQLAKKANADRAVSKYVEVAINLLGENSWHRQYQISLALHQLGAEAAFLNSELDQLESYVATVIRQAHTNLDQVGVYLTKIQALTFQQQYPTAIALGQSILSKLGVEFNDEPTNVDVQQAIQTVNALIGPGQIVANIADIFEQPPMVDAEKIAILQIAVSISPACHIVDSPLHPLVNALQVKLSIQYGNSPASAVSYAIYGCVLLELGHIEPALEFGRLADRFIAEAEIKNHIPEIIVPSGLYLRHRHRHLQETIPMFQLGYQIGLELGKLEYVGYCGYALCLHTYWCGRPLGEVVSFAQLYQQQLREIDRVHHANYCQIIQETALTLQGKSTQPQLAPPELIAQARQHDHQLFLRLLYLHRAQIHFLLGQLELATTDMQQLQLLITGTAETICKAGFYFYNSLIILANVLTHPERFPNWLATVQKNQEQLAVWAATAPQNYLHKWQLVAAEECRISGEKLAAIEHYDAAIAGAKAHGYLAEEALANELAAKFYLDWGKEKIAAAYLQEAYYSYNRWGAHAKAAHLTQNYFQLLSPPPAIDFLSTLTAAANSSSNSSQVLQTWDLASAIQSAQALSSSIELEELIYQLSHIILQNSGAETCLLVLPNQQGQWQIRSIATIHEACPIQTQLDTDLTPNLDYPVNLIYWIKNHQQPTIFDARHPLAISDQYLLKHQPPSVFGLPILKQGKVLGVLYLEHRQSPDIFTENRTIIISFLCTQAAIALDNAKIYQEAQESAEDARLQQSYLAALLNNIPHVAWLKNEHSQLISVNQSFAQLAGVDSKDLVGKNDYDIWPLELAQNYRDDDQLVMNTGQRRVVEEKIFNPQGEERWLETIKTPIRNRAGLITGTVGIALDITDRKQVQLDLHRTNHRLALSNTQLQRATQLKDEFLATMSHELRTPLNAILGMSEALQEEVFGDLNDRQFKSINTIKRSGKHLLSLINDILDVSKISAGKLKLETTTTTIDQLCRSSLVFIKQQAFEKQIELDLQLPQESVPIVVDDRRMRQVLINLLSNAVKFTPSGGQVIMVARYLEDASTALAGLEITVTDTGIGIASADRLKLFQPFVQLDSSLNRQQEGTGLGLILVKQIIELHGGTVQLQSELGQGSCFTIQLPPTCIQPAINGETLASLDTLDIETHPLPKTLVSPAVILLAEDNESNINTFSSYLTAKGYQLMVAVNGWEAIELVQQAPPDLILMDIQMPGMDGLEAISWIRQQAGLNRIPIIALTALAMEGDKERCLAIGATDYLAKPVKLRQLDLKIQELLGRN